MEIFWIALGTLILVQVITTALAVLGRPQVPSSPAKDIRPIKSREDLIEVQYLQGGEIKTKSIPESAYRTLEGTLKGDPQLGSYVNELLRRM